MAAFVGMIFGLAFVVAVVMIFGDHSPKSRERRPMRRRPRPALATPVAAEMPAVFQSSHGGYYPQIPAQATETLVPETLVPQTLVPQTHKPSMTTDCGTALYDATPATATEEPKLLDNSNSDETDWEYDSHGGHVCFVNIYTGERVFKDELLFWDIKKAKGI